MQDVRHGKSDRQNLGFERLPPQDSDRVWLIVSSSASVRSTEADVEVDVDVAAAEVEEPVDVPFLILELILRYRSRDSVMKALPQSVQRTEGSTSSVKPPPLRDPTFTESSPPVAF